LIVLCSTEKIVKIRRGWLVMANTYAAAAVVVRSSSLSR
jgi:hypothetical protein